MLIIIGIGRIELDVQVLIILLWMKHKIFPKEDIELFRSKAKKSIIVVW